MRTKLRPLIFTLSLFIVSFFSQAQPCGENCGSNLIQHGDFEDTLAAEVYVENLTHIRNNGYIFGSCTGAFVLDTSAVVYSGQDNNSSVWTVANDHSGNGNFLIIDPPCVSPGIIIWQQEVLVNIGSVYNFSVWVSNLSPGLNAPVVTLYADGSPISVATPVVYDTASSWMQICGLHVNVLSDTTVLSIGIGPSIDGVNGADLGVDDITLHENVLTGGNSVGLIDSTVCDSFVVPSGATTLFSSGIYIDHILNAAGCDSAITIDLTVINSSGSLMTEEVCESFTSPLGNVYTSSGIYYDTLINAVGCDSIITIDLTILEKTDSLLSVSSCNVYLSPDSNIYSSSGIYIDTILNAVGCDSIITIDLTILESTLGSISESVCAPYITPSGAILDSSGIYLDTILNLAGCDSIITIDLNILPTSAASIEETVCDAYNSPAGNIYTSSGIYLDTLLNLDGCDSVISIDLTVLESTSSLLVEAVCETDVYISPGGNEYSASGIYVDTISNAAGCDSVITIDLTILESTDSSFSDTACAPYISPLGNEYYSSGVYQETIVNIAGCDSVVTFNITVLYPTESALVASVCESFTSPAGNVYTSSGFYIDTLINAVGCDSLVLIDLTILENTSNLMEIFACESYISPLGNVYLNSGIYQELLQNEAGCDSLITIDLTIYEGSSSVISDTACAPYISPAGNEYFSSGTYQEIIQNVLGCDSLIVIHLTILDRSEIFLTEVVCDSFVSPLGNVYTTSGIYIDTLLNNISCDSVITIDLTVLESSSESFEAAFCQGDSYLSPAGNLYNNQGVYDEVISNVAGCDSAISIHLFMLQPSYSSLFEIACGPYEAPSGKIFSESGVYSDTISNQSGCDSIISIALVIEDVAVTIINNGNHLLADPFADTYQWIDCENNNAAIPGEVSDEFYPSESGNYAVVINNDGCLDTSACVDYIYSGLEKKGAIPEITLYPNPVVNEFYVQSEIEMNGHSLKMWDLQGRLVKEKLLDGSRFETISTSEIREGIYHLIIESRSGNQQSHKIVIARK